MSRKNAPLILLFLALLLGGCVTALPTGAPPPDVSQTGTPQETSVFAEPSATPTTGPAAPEVSPTTPPAAPAPTATPLPTLTPTPGPTAPAPESVRDLVLDYLRDGYRYRVPANDSFAPAELSLDVEGMEVIASFASGPFQMFVGAAEMVDGRLLTPVNLRNTDTQANWWGDVDSEGLVTTTVAAGLPRPTSRRISEWAGHVVKLPPGSPYDDYFEGGLGNRHGIASNRPAVEEVLERLGEYEGRVRIWGELRYGVNDYNARRLLVDRIVLLDGELPPPAPEQEEASAEPEAAVEASPEPDFGPTGALIDPLPGAVLLDSVRVIGEAEGVFENTLILQVEDAGGVVLGRAITLSDAAEMGQRGRFQAEVAFTNPVRSGPGRVALYSQNPIDGALDLLAWVNVRLAGGGTSGQAEIVRPQAGERIKGAVLVGGYARQQAGNVVLVRVEDLAGSVWGQARAKVNEAGEWELRLKFRNPPTSRPGRITLYELGAGDTPSAVLADVPVELAK